MAKYEFIRLTPDYAKQVEEVERKVYPPRLRLGRANNKANLSIFEKDGANMSVGLLRNDTLVGYLTAWPNETRAAGYDEEVVFVDDMAILQEEKDRFYGILAAFVEQIHEKKKGNLAIEGMTRRKAYKFLRKHKKVIRELGYEIKTHEEFFDEDIFEDMVWVRLHPVGA